MTRKLRVDSLARYFQEHTHTHTHTLASDDRDFTARAELARFRSVAYSQGGIFLETQYPRCIPKKTTERVGRLSPLAVLRCCDSFATGNASRTFPPCSVSSSFERRIPRLYFLREFPFRLVPFPFIVGTRISHQRTSGGDSSNARYIESGTAPPSPHPFLSPFFAFEVPSSGIAQSVVRERKRENVTMSEREKERESPAKALTNRRAFSLPPSPLLPHRPETIFGGPRCHLFRDTPARATGETRKERGKEKEREKKKVQVKRHCGYDTIVP